MSTWLVIDFGTTSTKSALVDLDTGVFHHVQHRSQGAPAIRRGSGHAGRHELSIDELLARFDGICRDAWARQPFEGIALCSEMHGFVVVDAAGSPVTDYVSWLDARSLETIDGRSTHDLVVEALGDNFRTLTGMRPRPGFPLLNLTHSARARELSIDAGWVLSLPAALARLPHDGLGEPPVEHATMLAAMALGDIEAGGAASSRLIDLVTELGGFTPRLGTLAADGQIAGHWPGPEGLVPIVAGVGDHQCSVLGARPAPVVEANLNLGTGSQVGIVDGPRDRAFEQRPWFGGGHLTAVTHIPAGRALAEYVGFLERVASHAGGKADFWSSLAAIRPEQVATATLRFDLALFEGARGWTDGGSVGGILEGSLDVDGWLAGLLAAFCDQYARVLDEIDPDRTLQRLVLSGGIARRLPHLPAALNQRTQRPVSPAVALDESLLGLRAIALHAAGRAASVSAATALHGDACVLDARDVDA